MKYKNNKLINISPRVAIKDNLDKAFRVLGVLLMIGRSFARN